MSERGKITVATTWLDGCSGCHMSFLDMDDRLIQLAEQIEVVYSPLVDGKTLPDVVDIGILEGSVSTDEDMHKAKAFRKHCKTLISLGDCAVNGNVPAMRNRFDLDAVFDRAYAENVTLNPQRPNRDVPQLLATVRPLHGVVDVDVFVPGCPPSADTIWQILNDLINGETPKPCEITRFGA